MKSLLCGGIFYNIKAGLCVQVNFLGGFGVTVFASLRSVWSCSRRTLYGIYSEYFWTKSNGEVK